jgi:beta-glucosidase
MSSPLPFLFLTGIENSYPVLPGGERLDQLDRVGHYARWERDFALARQLGVRALRYGPAYYRAHLAPDQFDWEVCDEPMRRLHDLGIEPIADLCHFGLPSWLKGFTDPAFPLHYAEYARAFARRYPWVRYFTPIHAILTCAARSALHGEWNDGKSSDEDFVLALRNLCMAHELAVEAILGERPDAIIVQSEMVEHVHAAGKQAAPVAERWNAIRFLALDLTLGREPASGMTRFLHEHGVASNELSFFRERRAEGRRWLGLFYFPESEQRVTGTGRRTAARQRLGFGTLARHYYQRYQVPLVHCGTHHAGRYAAPWLREQWESVLALRSSGVPVHGFGWHSLVDHGDVRSASGASTREGMLPVGLCGPDRELHPVGAAFKELVGKWSSVLAAPESQTLAGRRSAL